MNQTGSRYIPLLTGLLPVVMVNSTYLIAAAEGHVPWCIPYWDSCTSISATGRLGTAFWVFKLAMIPVVYLYIRYWFIASSRIAGHYASGQTMFYTGMFGALFLALHSLALGAEGDGFQSVRRVGISLYFAGTYFAQLQNTLRLSRSGIHDPTLPLQIIICTLVFVMILANLYLNASWPGYGDYEDAFAWISLLVVHAYFIISYWSWSSVSPDSAHSFKD